MPDRALLVGINAYPGCPLSGCVNDILMVADLLVSKYKFSHDSIIMLADGRATTGAILERLRWLAGVQPGDRCYFHYSGHGTQVASHNFKIEIDGLDEAICPVDFDWTEQHMITDKQLFEVFEQVPDGVRFNWTSDSCHSGDLTRDLPKAPVYPRQIPPPPDIAWNINVAKEKNIVKTRALVNDLLDVGFISGCRSDQTSADTQMNGIPCGAMTHFLTKALHRLPDTMTVRQVAQAVCDDLAASGYPQRPQAEGARADRPFLG